MSQADAVALESRAQQYRRHVRLTNPERYQRMKTKQRECMQRLRDKRRAERLKMEEILHNQQML
jgi:hypothetical protein